MVETKFTKGPWSVEYGVYTPENNYFSSVRVNEGGVADVWNEEDAHLIAAAPELYYALEGMLKYIPDGIVECRGDKCREPWCSSCYGFEEAESALDQIRFDYQRSKVALAKARGEQTKEIINES